MGGVNYGRKTYSFTEGKTFHTGTTITEKSLPGESEQEFTSRLTNKYIDQQGTIEVVFKGGHPAYAIIAIA